MSIEKELQTRSGSICELCTGTQDLGVYEVPPESNGTADQCIMACATCIDQIENPENMEPNHWRSLNDTMWSPEPPVQVMAWRMLTRLRGEGWPVHLLEMLYLEDATLDWAKATGEGEEKETVAKHVDSNGVEILSGDSIVLIKDLNVKGTSMVAKRGTAVRNVSLVYDNPEHIEGRVNGQQIVILTKFVKKT